MLERISAKEITGWLAYFELLDQDRKAAESEAAQAPRSDLNARRFTY